MYRKFIEEYLLYKEESEVHMNYMNNKKELKRLIIVTYIVAFALLILLFYYIFINKAEDKYIFLWITIPLLVFIYTLILFNEANKKLISSKEYNKYLKRRIKYSMKKAHISNTDNLLRIIEKDYSIMTNRKDDTKYYYAINESVKGIITAVVTIFASKSINMEQVTYLLIVILIIFVIMFSRLIIEIATYVINTYISHKITGQELKEIYENLGL